MKELDGVAKFLQDLFDLFKAVINKLAGLLGKGPIFEDATAAE